MMMSVVSVDLGSTALMVLELRGTWRGFEVVKAAERRLPTDTGAPCPPEQAGQALTELFSAHAIRPAHVVSAIPAHATFVRNLVLPFRDPRKIRDVLKFEIEPHIPYPVEDVLVDFGKIRDTDAGGCEVLAAAVPKSAMAEHLRIFEVAGLVPEVVIDQHFRRRDRLGRLLTALSYNPAPVGLGVDEDTAAVIQPDGTLRVLGSGAVTVVDAAGLHFTDSHAISRGQPVAMLGLRLHVLTAGCTYDLRRRVASPPVVVPEREIEQEVEPEPLLADE